MLNIEEITLFMTKLLQLENLSKTYGISTHSILFFKKNIGVNCRFKKIFLKETQLNNSKQLLLNIKTEKKLKTEVRESINFIKKIKTFKGTRHKLGYPCRGQRTHTNAKTSKKKLK